MKTHIESKTTIHLSDQEMEKIYRIRQCLYWEMDFISRCRERKYVLCSYGDGLNDPEVSTDYQELYEKMEKSYRMTLNHIFHTEEEQENTYLSGYSARAVIHGDWMEWSITELELPNLPCQAK